MAQDLFGPRDTSYTLLGIEFTPENGKVRHIDDKNFIIHLPFEAMSNPIHAYIVLSHECVHLLSPNLDKPVTILEEGIAMIFSLVYTQDVLKMPPVLVSGESYAEAAELVGLLMHIDPNGIKKMREEEFVIRKINKSLILKYYPSIPEDVAARLSRTFTRDGDIHPGVIEYYNNEIVT